MSSRHDRRWRALEKIENPTEIINAVRHFTASEFPEEENIEMPSSTENFERDSGTILAQALINWAIDGAIAPTKVTRLLHILRENLGPIVPADSRTLLGTPRAGDGRVHYSVLDEAGNLYAHLGLQNGLARAYKQGLRFSADGVIQVSIFVDGFAPVSHWNFTSILHKVYNATKNKSIIFASGLACGKTKIHNYNNLLEPLMNEMERLQREPFEIEGSENKHILKGGAPHIMDLPARCDVLNCKQGGYDSCLRCEVPGYPLQSVVFPGFGYKLKTDQKFREHSYLNQHGPTQLERLSGTDMVNDFVHEGMHTIFLGNVRRLFLYWTSRSNEKKWKREILDKVSANWKAACLSKPVEFRWAYESFEHSLKFKAKLYRFFLLYSGYGILKGSCSDEDFEIFATLSIAVRTLCDEQKVSSEQWIKFSEELLGNYVSLCQRWFGAGFIARVVHQMLHIPDDARRFGAIDNWSAWPFESYHQPLGNTLHGPSYPLKQMVARYLEMENWKETEQPHSDGLDVDNIQDSVIVGGKRITVKQPDNIIMDNEGHVYQVVKIEKNKNILLFAQKFMKEFDFFERPVKSSEVGIRVVSKLSQDITMFDVRKLKRKCFVSQVDGGLLVVPFVN